MLKGFRGSNLYIRRIARRYVRKLSDSEEISNISRDTARAIRERSSGITRREYTTISKKSRISHGILPVLYARNLTCYNSGEVPISHGILPVLYAGNLTELCKEEYTRCHLDIAQLLGYLNFLELGYKHG